MAKWARRNEVLIKIWTAPSHVREGVEAVLENEVEEMVQAMRRAAPVGDELETTPGQLRDSIHKYPTPDRSLSFRIIADATDPKGNFIGPHVEFGHKARDGGHVPPKGFFFPTYRARKKKAKATLRKAARAALKAATGGLAK